MRHFTGSPRLMTLLTVMLPCHVAEAQTQGHFDVGTRIWTVRHESSRGQHRAARDAALELLGEPRLQGPRWTRLRCDALLHLFLAHHRLGEATAAEEAYGDFIAAGKDLPRGDDVLHQMGELRKALGMGIAELRLSEPKLFKPKADADWPTLLPAKRATQIDPEVLQELVKCSRAAGGDGLLIAWQGNIVHEEYSSRYSGTMATMSSVKSMTGLLVGLALQDGKLDSVLDKVGKYLPDWREGRRGKVTVEHLLTMSSGLLRMSRGGVSSAGGDMYAYVRKLEPQADPGARWSYSNEGVQLLGATLSAALGEPLSDYADRRLFTPLGMKQTRLRTDRAGNAWCHADAITTLRDFARLGVVMAQGGRWKDAQVIPKKWVQRSLQPTPTKAGYGYLWWLHGEECFAMEGYLNTSAWIWPRSRLVVARCQARPSLINPQGLDARRFRELMAKLLRPNR